MAQPGLGRAVSFGILGFLLGALLVTVIRGLQGLDPLWDSGIGIVFAMLFCAFGFVGGIGAFNFRLSAHGEGPEVEAIHHELEEDARKPDYLLSSTIWQLAGILIGLVALIVFFALLPGGFALKTTAMPEASTAMVGYVEMQIGTYTVYVSQLVLFLIFVIFAFISLAVIAWALATAFYRYDRNYKIAQFEAKNATAAPALGSGGAAAAALPAPQGSLVVSAVEAPGAPAEQPVEEIRIPRWLENLIVYGSLLWFAMFPGAALFGVPPFLQGAWQLMWNLFIVATFVLFVMIIPAQNRPIGSFLKAAGSYLVIYLILYFGLPWLAFQIDPGLDTPWTQLLGISMWILTPILVMVLWRDDRNVRTIMKFALTYIVLFWVFYLAAIGLIIPQEPARSVLSIANAILISVIIWRLDWLLGLIGIGAGLLAQLLRWLPRFLFQRG
jgi:hypothetical protein